MPRRFPAIRFVQNGRAFYALSLPAGFLIDHTMVDVYDPALSIPKAPKGYQRAAEPTHVHKIARYVQSGDAVLPTSVLLNVRQRLSSGWDGRKDSTGSPGWLTIPEGTTIYVVDGQHRRDGFREAIRRRQALRDFPVPAILMEGFDNVQEALQFYLINTKAKKVPTDLAGRLLIEYDDVRYIEEVKPWRLAALRVTVALENNLENPWRGKIRPPNATKQPQYVCSEKSFVPSLQQLILNRRMRSKSPKVIATTIADYWKSLERLFGPAFGNPKAYRIQRTQGFYSLHLVAPVVVDDLGRKGRSLTVDNFERRLEPIRKLKSEFWAYSNSKGAKRFGGGHTGFRNLANFILRRLKAI